MAKPRPAPKGRQVDETARVQVRALLGPGPHPRHLLIEHLHAVHDRFGRLSEAHIAALAHEMALSQAEVFEVATFYHRFEVVVDGVPLPRPEAAPPLPLPPVPPAPPPVMGDYRHLRACRSGEIDLTARLEKSNLRGMGGAGFAAARKWRFFDRAAHPRHLVVNADEGEPGTAKDRWCLLHAPHRVLEGALIAAHAIEAEAIWIYLRDEYPDARAVLIRAIADLGASGLADGVAVHLRRGAGAYICGEETALLESIEGRRGLPRQKPPYPAESGLFGCPTLIHNVETLYWLPSVVAGDYGGQRLYSVSGRVNDPGIKEALIGITVRRLIDEHCGGMASGHTFTAYLPGGASGGILPEALGDLPLDFGALEPHGAFVGSGAVVVLSQADDVRTIARDLMAFFAAESCGQCTPCRLGTEKALALMEEKTWNQGLLRELAAAMRDASICGLGQAAPNPLLSVLDHFGGGGHG